MTSSWQKERFPRTARWLTALAWSSLIVIPFTYGVLSKAQTVRSVPNDQSGTQIDYVRIVNADGVGFHTQAARLEERLRSRFTTSAPEPYGKWMDEVEVLLTLDELKGWEAATSASDREDFVRRFWRQRDPNPETPANEFKEEYERRVRYANDRFAGAAMQGSMTVLGRAYKLLGPPDEIESHPSGGPGGLPPWEAWRWENYPAAGSSLAIKFLIVAN